MNIFELADELSKHPKEQIEMVLLSLMIKKKIEFVSLSNAYVEFLNKDNKDKLNRLIEAETCVMEDFAGRKIVKENKNTNIGRGNYNHTQRCLYLLNKGNRFNMNSLNKEYGYDEDYARTMSWYERNKTYEL